VPPLSPSCIANWVFAAGFLDRHFPDDLAWSISFIVYRLALLPGQSISLFLAALIGLVALIAISLKLISFGFRRRDAL